VPTPPKILTHLKLWLPLAAAAVAAALIVSAQTDIEPVGSEGPHSALAPDTAPAGSEGVHGGNITGKVTAGKGISVVWVEAVPGKTFPRQKKTFTVAQKALRFVPHIMAVPAGTVVDFLNGDNVQHNIFWPAISGNKKLSHSLGTWPKGQTRMFQFSTPGVVPLLCNVHPEMSAYIIVTPTPYLAETDDSGSFTIADVPDGSYTVTAWHEGFKSQSKPAVVASDVRVEFTLAK
jgi:plastocyanin